MATQLKKTNRQFVCQHCGSVYGKWQGRCDDCQEWNSLTQTAFPKKNSSKECSEAQPLDDIDTQESPRITSGISELDRLLGGGFVPSSVSLLGGEPGIGKSTLTMHIAQAVAAKGGKVLYISGEESAQQIVLRAERLGKKDPNILLLIETDIEHVCAKIHRHNPDLVVIDSIQVMQHSQLNAVPGTVSQVRYCADHFISCIKKRQSIGLMIGHITRDGHLAGPKVLEHMVDCIFFLEGEHRRGYRILRSYKNRYSATDEIGLFEMGQKGLTTLSNSSQYFIDPDTLKHPGTVVAPVEHGSRSLLVEVQALAVDASYGAPKRNFVGVDTHRANLMIATLEKNCGIRLGNKDIFINVVGGLKISEPALDLAMCMALLSSLKNHVIPEHVAAVGEVGLSGEIRAIPQLKQRLIELQRLGITHCLIPERNKKTLPSMIQIKPVFLSHLSHIIQQFKT
ncbi:MAG: DNA repair protein RadA [bacterium]